MLQAPTPILFQQIKKTILIVFRSSCIFSQLEHSSPDRGGIFQQKNNGGAHAMFITITDTFSFI
jgi:hypothetical protein